MRSTTSMCLVAITVLVAVVASCAPIGAPPAGDRLTGTIKIVSSLPRTGAARTFTDTLASAIRQARDDVNSRVGGATLTYVDLDDATVTRGNWDAAAEAANANTALNDPDVMVYIGPFNSGAASISIPILCPADLVMISPSVTYPGLTKRLPVGTQPNEPDVYYPNCPRNFTRIVPSEIQGGVAARWSKELGAHKVYVLDDTEVYGQGIPSFYAR